MGHCTGYWNQFIAEREGGCGRNDKGVYWDHGGTRYYFRDETARRWYARATVDGTVGTLHEYSQPLTYERLY
jgi:hypothetical protein